MLTLFPSFNSGENGSAIPQPVTGPLGRNLDSQIKSSACRRSNNSFELRVLRISCNVAQLHLRQKLFPTNLC